MNTEKSLAFEEFYSFPHMGEIGGYFSLLLKLSIADNINGMATSSVRVVVTCAIELAPIDSVSIEV